MKNTSRDPKKSGLPTGRQFSSISDLVIGNNLKEDEEQQPYADSDGRIHIYLKSISTSAKCPYCGQESSRRHGIIMRHPQWLPLQESPTVAHIKLLRYKCCNDNCKARTFVEELPELSGFKQNSDVVLVTIFAISIFCSASSTELICKQIGIQVSHDTIGRLYSNIALDDDSDVAEVGVDDVSRARGREYNTTIYDSSTHRLLAILNGRDGKELKEWLKQHPKITKIERDRASAYASAIKEILGNSCAQVADRFHILQNLLERIKELFKGSFPKMISIDQNGNIVETPGKTAESELLSQVSPDMFEDMGYNNDPVFDDNGKPIIVQVTMDTKKNAEHRQMKMQKVIAIKKELQGMEKPNYKSLSQKYGLSIQTVMKYSQCTDEQVKSICNKRRFSKPNCPMNDFDNIVYKMLKDGISPDEVYCRILALGYVGSLVILKNHITGIAYNHFGIKCRRKLGVYFVQTGFETISRNDIIKYITMRNKEKMNDQAVAKYFDVIAEKYPNIKRLSEIWEDGYSMVMGGNKDKVDDFIAKYKESEISSFVTGLKMDIVAVKNGVTDKKSSGFVEGNNCKYKLIKRTMYGKASTPTLMKKFYVASKICHSEISILDTLQLKVPRKYYSRRPLKISC